MKKLVTILSVTSLLLAAASTAQAHPNGAVGLQASISIAVPIGHNGYAVLGTGPYYAAPYYPAPRYYHVPPARAYGPAYRHGHGHGKGHSKHHHSSRAHDHRHDARRHH
jgi:hypothetical protein